MLQKCYKSKTNPKRTQTNPISWRPNFNFSLKMRIFDKFYKTFLCKTNPICASPALKKLGAVAFGLAMTGVTDER